jgi:hypothetical protein
VGKFAGIKVKVKNDRIRIVNEAVKKLEAKIAKRLKAEGVNPLDSESVKRIEAEVQSIFPKKRDGSGKYTPYYKSFLYDVIDLDMDIDAVIAFHAPDYYYGEAVVPEEAKAAANRNSPEFNFNDEAETSFLQQFLKMEAAEKEAAEKAKKALPPVPVKVKATESPAPKKEIPTKAKVTELPAPKKEVPAAVANRTPAPSESHRTDESMQKVRKPKSAPINVQKEAPPVAEQPRGVTTVKSPAPPLVPPAPVPPEAEEESTQKINVNKKKEQTRLERISEMAKKAAQEQFAEKKARMESYAEAAERKDFERRLAAVEASFYGYDEYDR